jgi:hypothetical protein
VYEDFCEVAALAVTTVAAVSELRDRRYQEVLASYGPDAVERFGELLGVTTLALDAAETGRMSGPGAFQRDGHRPHGCSRGGDTTDARRRAGGNASPRAGHWG